MIKKTLATVAVAASAIGATGAAAAPALAVGDDTAGHTAVSGNGAEKVFGNTTTHGGMSPNMALVQGSLNDICAPILPGKTNVGSVVGLIPVTVQDILTSTNDQTCAENSTQQDGDDPLSNLLSNVEVLSGNGGSLR
ncbi:rodlin [Streptomyces sp. SM14]|uniref:rodlin n=1 Tax=Streptomyces sp. SM14 TaxID=1736045 RepID=UPI000CD49DCA|nr:rodlin [Streptomyces sp. SM14]